MQAVSAPPSSEHRNVTPAWSAENVKLTLVLSVWKSGPMSGTTEPIVVSGAAVISHVCVAGVASTLDAPSLARTRNSCDPEARPVYSAGEEQELNEPASSAHSNVEPGSLLEKLKVAFALALVAAGARSIVVFGGRSTVQARVAGLWSVLPAVSVARTRKVWSPAARSA